MMRAAAVSRPAARRIARPGVPGRRAAAHVPVARPAAPGAVRPPGRRGPTRPVRQRGVALVIALVLLIATSALAMATLSSTRLSETMASNAQHKAVVFEVAESGLESAWTERGAIVAALGAGSGNGPAARSLDAVAAPLGHDYDQTQGAGLDLDGTLTVQFCGEAASRTGSEMNADTGGAGGSVSVVFDIVSAVESSAVGADDPSARARHVQRGVINGPRLGRVGACPAP